MDKTLGSASHLTGTVISPSFKKALWWGFLGGLAGTLIMDLLLMGVLLVLRQSAGLCFSIVGDTISTFLAVFGAHVAGGVPTGVLTHYLVGPLFGIIFGTAVAKLPALRGSSIKKITIAAFVYVEILSQPLLATTPILLKMDAPGTLLWFGGSFVMHLVLSIVLGLIVGYGLRPSSLATQKEN